jgi:hypothetical protein
MGAPTWPPTPEDAHKATLEEYGELARKVLDGIDDDEEAEQALLARFLFEPPKRQLVAGEENGTPLDDLAGPLQAWLRMVAASEAGGAPFSLAYSDPPSTDREDVFLPRAVPAPAQAGADALLYRCMGLMQVGLARFGFLQSRALLAEMHRDWVLRSAYHLLAARCVARRWSARWPGIRVDFEAVPHLDKATAMRVNVMAVPRQGMPAAFLPLYDGLAELGAPGRGDGSDPGPARRAIAAVDALPDLRGAPLVCAGQAQALREAFRRQRLGPPPLPYWIGVIRPEWILHDLRAERAAQDEWKQGPKPLRQLLDAVKRKGGPLPEALRRTLRADGGAPLPGPDPGATTEVEARPGDDGARLYDEWDEQKGAYRMAFTRVEELPAHGGPKDSYERIATANQPQIAEVRRRFEALRVEERWVHGQADGTEIDLNRAIAAVADLRAGHSPRVDWYVRFQRRRQSVSVLTLVDLSGSTQGPILAKEQEAVVIFAEGLRVLGVPHSFAGFSNQGPRQCTWQVLKGWDEAYGDPVFKRMANLRAGGATRMGAFLRHAAWQLGQRKEGRRILLMVSDGRPEDRDDYRGRQGLRDAAMAVHEARRLGIHVHCVSLDHSEQAEDWLHELFGPGHYLVVDRVDDLPVRLPEVFRALVR